MKVSNQKPLSFCSTEGFSELPSPKPSGKDTIPISQHSPLCGEELAEDAAFSSSESALDQGATLVSVTSDL